MTDRLIRKLSHEELKAARPVESELGGLSRCPITVVCENIRSLYNVGSIFRTSDGAGIEKLYLCGYTGYPPRPEIEKTSLGSVRSVPWEYVPNQFEAVRLLKKRGYHIVALEHTNRSVSYDEASYTFPLCLVIGNEVTGITDELLNLCDMAVDIPMHGLKQSLNVSVAYGILVYHIARFSIPKRGVD
ncbi:MAG TPA: RNA methyltransferase [Spirochaetota bacterium]|nr:RNA methyltransferase [Spirochaetota bacterium]HOD13615.1 RNA methyltransferase [Spirochaetota bacterium]HPG51948.1 RNA methyltransferase [Spirochaetota bacterium]HPN12892.1 RNA methyltransferase [Spirochaetota bacterium]HQL82479.1 RNA methyltransferase [Spirochaetota bacterium]